MVTAHHDQPPGSGPLLQEQEKIARFGDHALRSDDLQSLLQEAAVLAAEGLRAEQAKILELLPDGHEFLVCAGYGWGPEVVGKTIIGTELKSPAGFALRSGQPVISEDVAQETRFEIPDLLHRYGIRSAVNVIIGGHDAPFGVLEVDSSEARKFDEEDLNFLRSYANLLAAAIERLRSKEALKKAVTALEAATAERALLLRELQHRVKNNLQTVTSIVHLQQTLARKPEIGESLEAVANRLRAMSLLHNQLYALDRTHTLELDAYLHDLCESLFRAVRDETDAIRLDIRLEKMVVAVDTGLPIGLITNEFIANSLKHAFPHRTGTVVVTLRSTDDGTGELVLADDGVGRPRPAGSPTGPGLGLRLIQRLVDQIDASIEWRHDRGTEARVIFPH